MYDCDIPVDGVAAFVFTTAERARDLPHPPVYVAGYAQGHPNRHRLPLHWPLDDIMDVGRADQCAAVGPLGAVGRMTSTCRSSTTASPRSCGSGSRRSATAPPARPTGSSPTAASKRRTGGLPALSGGGALGNGRMHGVPQMLECYLQLSQRAGDRQLASYERRPRLPLVTALGRRRALQPRTTLINASTAPADRGHPPTITRPGSEADMSDRPTPPPRAESKHSALRRQPQPICRRHVRYWRRRDVHRRRSRDRGARGGGRGIVGCPGR